MHDDEQRGSTNFGEPGKGRTQPVLHATSIKARCALFVCVFMWPLLTVGEDFGEGNANGRNKLELFVGATHLDIQSASEEEFSVGITYEWRVNDRIGVGGLVEFTNGIEAWAWAVPVFIHPTERIRLTVASGAEFEDSREDFLIRVGAAYEFEFGELSLSPEFNVDFVDGERNEVYGISIGFSF